jgi:hypothetical protein
MPAGQRSEAWRRCWVLEVHDLGGNCESFAIAGAQILVSWRPLWTRRCEKARRTRRASVHLYGLSADVLGLEGRLAVFEEHGDDLGEVPFQLVNRLSEPPGGPPNDRIDQLEIDVSKLALDPSRGTSLTPWPTPGVTCCENPYDARAGCTRIVFVLVYVAMGWPAGTSEAFVQRDPLALGGVRTCAIPSGAEGPVRRGENA